MIIGYHMASLPWHDEATAMPLLAEFGYQSIALIPRRTTLHLGRDDFDRQLQRVASATRSSGLQPLIVLEGPFISDPLTRRWPAIASTRDDEADATEELTTRWIQTAAQIDARLVTISLGEVGPGESYEDSVGPASGEILDRVAPRLGRLLRTAKSEGVRLAIRPTQNHLVATVAQYERLLQWLECPDDLGLAAGLDDMIQGLELPLSDRLLRHQDRLDCLFVDGRHFPETQLEPGGGGGGHIDAGRVVTTLRRSGYSGHLVLSMTDHPLPGLGAARRAMAGVAVVLHPEP